MELYWNPLNYVLIILHYANWLTGKWEITHSTPVLEYNSLWTRIMRIITCKVLGCRTHLRMTQITCHIYSRCNNYCNALSLFLSGDHIISTSSSSEVYVHESTSVIICCIYQGPHWVGKQGTKKWSGNSQRTFFFFTKSGNNQGIYFQMACQ